MMERPYGHFPTGCTVKRFGVKRPLLRCYFTETRTNPRPKGALSPNARAQNHKQTTDGIKSTADTSKPTISRPPSNTVSSIISENGDEPKSSLKEPTPSKRSAPEALNGQPAAVKQKREEAPEEKPKKDLHRCHECQEDYDLNAQDDKVIYHFHPGQRVKDLTAPCWHRDTSGWHFERLCRHFYNQSEVGYRWDCCGNLRDSPGCITRNFHKYCNYGVI
ncbi:hypothetical protein B0T09DRAFT_400924 [Sordaria sp. MPI-SDFR-AT-0083]|nr:hypothetical protein B0T09DRAFT_400924 [Sordaria sp. MPI-SDFR-AT-0083]